MNKVLQLNDFREKFQTKKANEAYQAEIAKMDKLQLLNEMVQFQEERTEKGKLTKEMVLRGRVLFAALEETADTRALRALTRSYRRHLDHEYEELQKAEASRTTAKKRTS